VATAANPNFVMFISPLWLFEPWRERRGSDAQSAGGGGAWCRSDPLTSCSRV
jgi:hypothetical protein